MADAVGWERLRLVHARSGIRRHFVRGANVGWATGEIIGRFRAPTKTGACLFRGHLDRYIPTTYVLQ